MILHHYFSSLTLFYSNYDYDEDTSLLTSVTVNGKKTMYQYDEDGFLSEVRFPDNNSIRYRYDNKKLLESSR